jgi:hypothetical protein
MRWNPNHLGKAALTDRLHRPDVAAHLISELVVPVRQDVKSLPSEWTAEANVRAWDGTFTCGGGDEFTSFRNGKVQLCGVEAVGWASEVDDGDFMTQMSFEGTKAQPDDIYGVRVKFTTADMDIRHVRLSDFTARLTRKRDGGEATFNGMWLLHIYSVGRVHAEGFQLAYVKTVRSSADDMGADEALVSFNLAEKGLALTGLPGLVMWDDAGFIAGGAHVDIFFSIEAYEGRYDEDPIVGAANAAWVTYGPGESWASLPATDGTFEPEHFMRNAAGRYDQTPKASLGADFTAATAQRLYFTCSRIQYADPAGGDDILDVDIDLGAAPDSDTDLEIRFEDFRAAGLVSICEISDDAGVGWSVCDDGDLIGVDNASGNDLSSIDRQQTYRMRWKAQSNAPGVNGWLTRGVSPTLVEMGVIEHTKFDVTELISYRSLNGWRVDPLTLEATVGEVLVDVARDGQRDFNDLVSRLVVAHPFDSIELRVYMGHEDMPRNEWGLIERLIVDDLAPLHDGTQFRAVSVLEQLAGRVPVADFVSGERAPIIYDNVSIATVLADLVDSEISLPARFASKLSENTTDLVKKTLLDADGVKEVAALLFLDGKALVASQGRVKSVNMHSGDKDVAAVFGMDQIEIASFDPGFRRRQPEYYMRFGYGEGEHNEFIGEVRQFNAAALAAIGIAKIEQEPLRPPKAVELWIPYDVDASDTDPPTEVAKESTGIPYSSIAAARALRITELFGTGMHLLPFQTQYAHPWLQIGDQVLIEQDLLVFRDPVTGKELKGVAWVPATIIEQYDLEGTQFLAWVESLSDIFTVADTLARPGSGEIFVWAELRSDALWLQPANARYQLNAWPASGDPGIVWIYQDMADDIPPRELDGASFGNAVTPGQEIVLLRDPSLAKRLALYGVRHGRMGPTVTVTVQPDMRAQITSSTVLQTNPGSGGNALVKRSDVVDPQTERVQVYRRLDNWPTTNDTQAGNVDPLYSKGHIDSADEWAFEDGGYSTDDVIYEIHIPINAGGNAGPRQESSYTVLSGDPDTPTITLFRRIEDSVGTSCADTFRRKITLSWILANSADVDQDLEIYVRINGGAWALEKDELNPVSVTSYQYESDYTEAAGPNVTEDFKIELKTGSTVEDTAVKNDNDNFEGTICPV